MILYTFTHYNMYALSTFTKKNMCIMHKRGTQTHTHSYKLWLHAEKNKNIDMEGFKT